MFKSLKSLNKLKWLPLSQEDDTEDEVDNTQLTRKHSVYYKELNILKNIFPDCGNNLEDITVNIKLTCFCRCSIFRKLLQIL